ncbi:hypothetical protein HN51_035920 [Arachis hypogaea]
MWFVYVCDEGEKELGRQQAPGSCPYCGGKVEAMDVEIQWSDSQQPVEGNDLEEIVKQCELMETRSTGELQQKRQ